MNMIRTVIGGLVAGIIIFVIGFIFWADRHRAFQHQGLFA
jgi:hypothetical protein